MKSRVLVSLVIIAVLIALPTAAFADGVPAFEFTTPLFGMDAAADGSLLVADTGAGIVELRKDAGKLIVDLPGVIDVASQGRGNMFAIANGNLYQISRGSKKNKAGPRMIANLAAFEETVNPDGLEINPNPFDLALVKGGKNVLVADAGGNSLLIVDHKGNIDWVATLPLELAPTAYAKTLVGCPDAPPDFAFVCGLPEMIEAQAVATSVAIGKDGAFYVSELKGFPAPQGMSRVWRIEPDARHEDCGVSPKCSVVADGFTSIIDLAFGRDGSLYVVEFDEATWAAVEFGLGGQGGTVNKCNLAAGTCEEIASGLPLPVAVALTRDGTLYAIINALVPGAAQVITLP